MSKFNQRTNDYELTTNREGATAYLDSARSQLVNAVLTTFLNTQGKFYNTREFATIVKQIRENLKTDPEFVAKLGVYTRTVMNLRSVSHVIFAELAHTVKGQPYVATAINRGIIRVDDMSEILSYYLNTYGKPIPNSLKKGLGRACNHFGEYQFAKYNRDGNVTIQDIFNLCHPIPENTHTEHLFHKVIYNELAVPETWETYLSANGNNKESWEHLIGNNSLGYMALLRNLRNIEKANVSEKYKLMVINKLIDEDEIAKNKQLPFRYYSAYRELNKNSYFNSDFSDAVVLALERSVVNIPVIRGTTCIAIDCSGSMSSNITSNGSITCNDISLLLGVLCAKRCEKYTIILFNDKAKFVRMNKFDSILTQISSIRTCSGGTDLTAPIKLLMENNIKVDRVIYLSDNEINNYYDNNSYHSYYFSNRGKTTCQQVWNSYKATINKNAWLHAIDLEGYGTQQFKGKKVNIIAGWNERILEFISLVEAGQNSLIDKINDIQI